MNSYLQSNTRGQNYLKTNLTNLYNYLQSLTIPTNSPYLFFLECKPQELNLGLKLIESGEVLTNYNLKFLRCNIPVYNYLALSLIFQDIFYGRKIYYDSHTHELYNSTHCSHTSVAFQNPDLENLALNFVTLCNTRFDDHSSFSEQQIDIKLQELLDQSADNNFDPFREKSRRTKSYLTKIKRLKFQK